jgi:streptogramin lyase
VVRLAAIAVIAVLAAVVEGDFVAQSHKVLAVAAPPACPVSGPPYPSAPLALASGSLWIACPGRGVLVQASAVDGSRRRVVRVGRSPSSVVAAHGGLWVEDDAGALVRLDDGGAVSARVPVARAYGVWAGSGSVWTLRRGGDELVRVDAARARVAARFHVGTGPSDVAFGDGAVWLADHGDGGVYRVDPATRRVERRARLDGTPISIADAGGAVWVTGPGLGLVRVDPRTGATRTVARLGAAGGIAVVADGSAVFAVGAGAAGSLSPVVLVRAEARSSRIAALPLPAAARRATVAGLAAGAGRLWMLDGSTGRLVRLPR